MIRSTPSFSAVLTAPIARDWPVIMSQMAATLAEELTNLIHFASNCTDASPIPLSLTDSSRLTCLVRRQPKAQAPHFGS